MQFEFGTGVLWATPLLNSDGSTVANPTPVRVGVLQEAMVSIEYQTKELYGYQQFPVAVGRGTAKISGSAKYAQFNGQSFDTLVLGQGYTSGLIADYFDTTGTAIPSTPYEITPTIPNSGTWEADLGVVDSNGVPMVAVASSPATGQYSVAAGVYTFAAADTGKTVFIDFKYTATVTGAKKATVTNPLLGYQPVLGMDLYMPYQGKTAILHLYQNVFGKFTITTKQQDFVIPEITWSAYADSQNRVYDWSMSE